jgi:hypothetical protein
MKEEEVEKYSSIMKRFVGSKRRSQYAARVSRKHDVALLAG